MIEKIVKKIAEHYISKLGTNATCFIIDDSEIDDKNSLFVIFNVLDKYNVSIDEIVIFNNTQNSYLVDLPIIQIEYEVEQYLKSKIL